jgi:hypothetical protein
MRVAGVTSGGLHRVVMAVEEEDGAAVLPVTGAEPDVVKVAVGRQALVAEKGFNEVGRPVFLTGEGGRGDQGLEEG